MRWSKYNLFFRSERFGYLLYNSLSNSFAEIGDATAQEIEKIRRNADGYDFSQDPLLYMKLLKIKALLTEAEEQDLLRQMKLRKYYSRFDNTSLGLTVMPTAACNFDCVYCYQGSKAAERMDAATENKLSVFVENYPGIQRLYVTWYGGEPLLGWDTIRRLSGQFKKLNLHYGAGMITNGYLLDEQITGQLDELSISYIQVTLDGPAQIHDQRRMLAGGGETFAVIMQNLERLINKERWGGRLSVRVNVDTENQDNFADTYRLLTDRLAGGNVGIYPGYVDCATSASPDWSCGMHRPEKARFALEQYHRYGLDALSYYPRRHMAGCIATNRNGFVVGPAGELYKCWNNVGHREMAVGNIHDRQLDTNLLAKYMVGVEQFDDPACLDCFYLPVCEICPDLRFQNLFGGERADICAVYKDSLPEFLEAHYAIKRQKKKRAEP